MQTLIQDLRYGVRVLLKNPGFTAVAVFVMALGIGANTTIFSVVNAVLLRPLPYADSDRLVRIQMLNTKRGDTSASVSFPNFADYRAQNDVFEAMVAYSDRTATLTGNSAPERITGLDASVDLFNVLGTRPLLGRTFIPEDEQADAAVVILSYGMWQRRFGSNPDIVGQQLTFSNKPRTVIGVLPADFTFPFINEPLEYFLPINPKGQQEIQRGAGFFEAIGKLKPGVTILQAEAALRAIAARLEQEYPEDNGGMSISLISAHEDLVGNLRTTLFVLLGAVGFVLLIACANVANLQLARAARRGREMAIRVALGASRWRIIRQLLTESLTLSILGGVLGLLVTLWTLELISAFVPADIPRVKEAGLNLTVLFFTLAASILTGVFFGLAPALQASKINLNEALKEGGRSTTEGRARHRVRSLLIISEVALSLVLLVGAGLLIKSFLHLRHTNPGFNAQNVLTASITLPRARYPKAEQILSFYKQLAESALRVPGVEAFGAILPLPYSESGISTSFTVVGQPDPGTGARPTAGARLITPDYLRAMGIPLISGRAFTDQDTKGTAKVILVNQALAERFFPGMDAVGQQLSLGLNNIQGQIVGVVGNVRDHNLDKEPGPEYYISAQQLPIDTMSLVVRSTTIDPASLAASLRTIVQESDKDIPLYRIRSMESLVANSIARQRFSMTLLVAFAALALALAAVGVFSVMSFLVAQRTHEIGVRMALGAEARDILKMIVRHGMGLTMIGIALGIAAALVLTQVMKTLLYEVSTTDPLTFILVPLLLTGMALVACFVPARRATKVDPMVALRYE